MSAWFSYSHAEKCGEVQLQYLKDPFCDEIEKKHLGETGCLCLGLVGNTNTGSAAGGTESG